ncbi:MAG: ammonium transporter [Planctomycetes bacterium]|nr:ammonium transporter [Planctomycetota bacterium]
MRRRALIPVLLMAAPLGAAEAAAPAISSGDTAWMMTATAFVMLMTIPGLAIFYGGLVRSKNVLSILAQCLAITCLVSLLWVAYGYSLAFDQTGMVKDELNRGSFIGGLSRLFLLGMGADSVHPLAPTIPESVFCAFQLGFAVITPALIVGAFAERMRFCAVMWFTALWLTLAYLPICHMAWAGDGSLFGSRFGLFDFAGGTVIEINSGVSSLVAALVVGRRLGFPQNAILPHDSVLCIIGGALLWIGWFGFNAGSAVAANGSAGMALLATHFAGCAAGMTWMTIEWMRHRKSSAVGIVTGAVAGLVAITPACGFVGPLGAIVIGAVAAFCSYFAVTMLKRRFAYDDTLDVFGVHGIGGLVGTLLTGVFASSTLGGMKDGVDILAQLGAQAACSGITIVWAVVATLIALKLTDLMVGLRVKDHEENQGLDLVQHGEVAYNTP